MYAESHALGMWLVTNHSKLNAEFHKHWCWYKGQFTCSTVHMNHNKAGHLANFIQTTLVTCAIPDCTIPEVPLLSAHIVHSIILLYNTLYPSSFIYS